MSAAASSLSLSLSTGLLAVAMLVAGSLSEVVGRKPIMVASLLLSRMTVPIVYFMMRKREQTRATRRASADVDANLGPIPTAG